MCLRYKIYAELGMFVGVGCSPLNKKLVMDRVT